jgi:hypothetical protein
MAAGIRTPATGAATFAAAAAAAAIGTSSSDKAAAAAALRRDFFSATDFGGLGRSGLLGFGALGGFTFGSLAAGGSTTTDPSAIHHTPSVPLCTSIGLARAPALALSDRHASHRSGLVIIAARSI